MKNLDKIKNKVYLLGYNNEINKTLKNFDSEPDCEDDIDLFVKKYGCEYEYINIEDIYKIKAIIIENIKTNFFRAEKRK